MYTLPTHIYIQTTWKVNFASDDPFKESFLYECQIKSFTLKSIFNVLLWFKVQLTY